MYNVGRLCVCHFVDCHSSGDVRRSRRYSSSSAESFAYLAGISSVLSRGLTLLQWHPKVSKVSFATC